MNNTGKMNYSLEEIINLIEALCRIPAPSGKEERRAEFCKNWLEDQGAEGVYIDAALNVIYPVGCCNQAGQSKKDLVVFMAHTDTVFPDMEPMAFYRDDKYIYAPGVGDDTTCLAMVLLAAAYVARQIKAGFQPEQGILFAANSCEEGLGNLKGIKQLMEDYKGRVKAVYTFDSQYDAMVNKCVGSHRYQVTFRTEGGHSFSKFGNRNAIHAMSQLICRLYQCQLPADGDSKTTYNVGIAEGGTSVNTIAQEAKMYYEYRSDSAECLGKMQSFFENEIQIAAQDQAVSVEVEVLGTRPCSGDVDQAVLDEMSRKAAKICEKHSGVPCVAHAGSTDCNIPMSLGVPAIAVGSYLGSGEHTREEKVLIESLPVGMRIVEELVLGCLEM